jgi:phosphatidylinositol-3,4,5-trisphosphate 3-phosphatase and dual-specificity protein phosphatase PTEN
MVLPFCRDVENWFNEHKDNVAAIHCKAGKGRTGFFISCFLVYTGQQPNANRALEFYGEARTHNKKGVTIPSQIRFVKYFDRYLKALEFKTETIPDNRSVNLTKLCIQGVSKSLMSTSVAVWFVVTTSEVRFSSKGRIHPHRYPDAARPYIEFEVDTRVMPPVDDDVKLEFYHGTMFGKQKVFQCWMNTRFFMPTLECASKYEVFLNKIDLDKACKDTKHKQNPAELAMQALFEDTA